MNQVRLKLLLLVWSIVVVLTFSLGGAALAQKATTTASRNPDGSTRISIQVAGAAIQDVHLCVAKTDPTTSLTKSGDPIDKHYSSPAGAPAPQAPPPPARAPTAKLPNGWVYQGIVEIQQPGADTLWCATWINPAAALGGAGFTFVVDYDGDKGDVKLTNENLFLTKNGANSWVAGDVLNGKGKGEKGHAPS